MKRTIVHMYNVHISEKATSFGKRSPPQPLPLYCSVAVSVVHIQYIAFTAKGFIPAQGSDKKLGEYMNLLYYLDLF